jgi:hypothetical protein
MNYKEMEILNEHINYIRHEVINGIESAKKSGALYGDENIHALIRACTLLTMHKLVLTKEAKDIYENLKHFI